MINTAVMRATGFCGGSDQARNVNYCMAPGLGTIAPLSKSEVRNEPKVTNERAGLVHGKMGSEQSGLTGGNHVSSTYT